ncbi:LamB/YcsF family protein [Paenibacillus thalictri]|uniref:5-oxoprolinase subunit A n=1 Tax=Paenibacillus thalictri TaxID=2527873 RepID=A0A4Q9DQJ7_9BACL|nr:5-oxoprolinase subunit PxpA [Paenibacillus thalictri]TBL78683.1 LamB/YcsF family protein [Paenibacillus thalictri]
MKYVDLNCDMGESFGAYTLGNDAEMLKYVSSANIACGFHAGDPGTMRQTVKLALEYGTAIGAHPGLPDLAGFGRRKMSISPQEAYEMTVYQIGSLWAFVRSEGGVMRHVKPHGELYNMAAADSGLAEAIAEAVYKVEPELVLYGLSGSELIRAGEKAGLRTASEVFADRTYQQDGSLTPRRIPGSVLTDDQEAARQVIRMVSEGKVRSVQNIDISIQADTVCIHGDGAHAVPFAAAVSGSLKQAGIVVQAVGLTR